MKELELFKLMSFADASLTINQIMDITGYEQSVIEKIVLSLVERKVISFKNGLISFVHKGTKIGLAQKYEGRLKITEDSTNELPTSYREGDMALYLNCDNGATQVIYDIDAYSPIFAEVIRIDGFFFIKKGENYLIVNKITNIAEDDVIEYVIEGNKAVVINNLGNKKSKNMQLIKLGLTYGFSLQEIKSILSKVEKGNINDFYLKNINVVDSLKKKYLLEKQEMLEHYLLEVAKYQNALFMSTHIGEELEVEIIGFTPSMFIVRTSDGIECFCDYIGYKKVMEEGKKISVTSSSTVIYELGTKICARVETASLESRAIILVLRQPEREITRCNSFQRKIGEQND